jgi:peptidoglycan/LPS O-acetylase OafA/YrhL
LLLGQYNTASHFWTLTVEFQFYFIIPFILIYQNKIGFRVAFAIFCAVILAAAIGSILLFRDQADFMTGTIVFRGIEFGCGITVARLLLKNKLVLTHRTGWLMAFIVLTYSGRALLSNPVLLLSHSYYAIFKLSGFILMGAGFAGIVYLAVTSVKWLNLILGNQLFKKMGRISYSFYLLHALVFPTVVIYTIRYMPFDNSLIAPVFSTLVSAIILYPVSLISFNLLEKPFLAVGNLTNKNI